MKTKLATKHGISELDVYQAFANRDTAKKYLKDTREDHKTDPASLWFVSENDQGIKIKVVFIYYAETSEIHLKTAYRANDVEIQIYQKHS